MKIRAIALAAVAALWCGACSLFVDETNDKDDDAETTTVVYDGTKSGSSYEYLYIDLEDPENPSTSGTGTDWDIMITGQREVLTNSGVTASALGSSGCGGVVFSGETDIDSSLTEKDAEKAFAADSGDGADYAYWDKYKTTSAAPTASSTGNAISFPGYKTQDGRDGTTAAAAWVFGEVGAHVDVDFSLGTAYAQWERMTPSFSDFNGDIYYIRSGDGKKYYKLQIPEVVYTSSSASSDGKTHYTFKIEFCELE